MSQLESELKPSITTLLLTVVSVLKQFLSCLVTVVYSAEDFNENRTTTSLGIKECHFSYRQLCSVVLGRFILWVCLNRVGPRSKETSPVCFSFRCLLVQQNDLRDNDINTTDTDTTTTINTNTTTQNNTSSDDGVYRVSLLLIVIQYELHIKG